MDPVNLFLRNLLERIDAQASSRSTELADGKASSFDDYKARAAYIRALKDVVDWCNEEKTKLSDPNYSVDPRKPSRYLSQADYLGGR